MNFEKGKILVAMSGGVDSSVAAALLVEAGYEVTGMFAVNYDDSDVATHDEEYAKSCWVPDYRDALRVAAKLGIPLLKLNFTKEYKELVLDYMYSEYAVGRTPNPDVMCNRYIKFGVWLDKARELGFDKLATGHYATVTLAHEHSSTVAQYKLRVAKDTNKDQTYFLHQLTQGQLSHVLFPIGDYTKKEIRELAKKFDLPTAEKEESMGICFVGEVDMKTFLQDKIGDKVQEGNIIFSDGTILGQHEGLALYTIGQRHVGVESGKIKGTHGDTRPLFVVDKRLDTDELVVGYEDDPLLWRREAHVLDMHWISGREPLFPLQCEVRLRHRQKMQNAQITRARQHDSTTALLIDFDEPQRAVTPGQFAVLYKDDECLGGGVVI